MAGLLTALLFTLFCAGTGAGRAFDHSQIHSICKGELPLAPDIKCRDIRIDEKVGSGTFGSVWRGWDSSGASFALKTSSYTLQIYAEACALQVLAEISGVPTLHGLCQSQGYKGAFVRALKAVDKHRPNRLWIIMQMFEPKAWISLSSLIHRWHAFGPPALGDVLAIASSVCSVLANAHSLGIQHNDVKSANILVSASAYQIGMRYVSRLIDWGLASSTTEPPAGTAVGTPQYMAPESAQGRPHTGGAADIWSLGIVLYEMLCGRVPFLHNPMRRMISLSKPLPLPNCIPQRIAPILKTMLAINPEERAYASTICDAFVSVSRNA